MSARSVFLGIVLLVLSCSGIDPAQRVTVRDRDSLEQDRVASDKLVGWIRERLA